MRIEADIFSGRPNPSFDLNAEQSAALIALLQSLHTGGEPREPPGLGYRGFLIGDAEAVLPGITRLRAFGGTVVSTSEQARVLSDPSRTVEQWLLQAGCRHLESGVFNVICAEFGRQ
jgi:hypothetical protein